MDILALSLSLLLGIIHYLSEKLKPIPGGKFYRIISFGAGISIGYLFLDLLPDTYEAAAHLKNWVFFFLLLGFSLFHLGEKYIYQHTDQKYLARELKEIHSISFFAYYFLVGIVLRDEIQLRLLDGILFMIPIALHAALSTASLARIHGEIRESKWIKITLSSSSVLGVFFALAISIPAIVNNILISLISGIILYIFVREFIPEKEKGQPIYFILGIILFSVFSLIVWQFK